MESPVVAALDPVDAGPTRVSVASHARKYGFFAVFGALAVIGLFTPNGLIASAGILTLPVLGALLWREGEPPVLLFGCAFQWLQATAAIFYTNHFHQTLAAAYGSNVLTIATWLSIASVLVLAVGARLGFMNSGLPLGKQLETESAELDLKKIGVLYLVSVVLSSVLTPLAWTLSSIAQPLLAIGSLKWAIVFLLCYSVLQQRRGYGLVAFCVVLEFFLGFTGIYSNFKSVFFVLVVAALSSSLALRGRRLAVTSTCFAALFVMGIIWSAVKVDYRSFVAEEGDVTGGAVPIERKFTKLADLTEDVTWENIEDGLDALIMRIGYVNFFSLTIENVPARIPFENGELWKGSIIHVLTPRLFFPDKPTLDDSERTRTYTGIEVAGMEQNTSIGIGYVGESYIDFGPIGMFAPIFLLGLLYGVINRLFITRTRFKLLGASLAVAVLVFNAYEIETSNIKLLGGVITVLLAAVIFYKVCGVSVMAYLQRSPSQAPSWFSAGVPRK